MNRKSYMKLDAPYKVKYEAIQDFDDSVFNSVYKHAAQITKEIVKKNKDYHSKPKKGNDYRNNEQIYNLISFVGERGSGKTSCMLSFTEYLKDYHKIERLENYSLGDVDENLIFIGINAIDAGLLEENEDIVEVVLAKMLGQLQNWEDEGLMGRGSEYDFQKREFNKCLEEVYSSNLRRKKKEENGTFSSVNALYNMSVSVNMRENIKTLVEKYIGLMKRKYVTNDVSNENCFVVIPIDDIDMNLTKGYEMLEQIRRYLMVPNVIILLSYNYEQLKDNCNLYYINKQNKLKDIFDNDCYREKIIGLSREYMEKVAPDGRRIVLPNINNLELLLEEEVYIIPTDSELRKTEWKMNARTIEQTFLRKIFRCFDIRNWTPEGGMELWEMKNLRNLCNLYNELHCLGDNEKIFEHSKSSGKKCCELEDITKKIFVENYNWLLEYIEQKARLELSENERDIFIKIKNQPLQKLNQTIIKECVYLIKKDMQIYQEEISYGTILYVLDEVKKQNPDSLFTDIIKGYLSARIGKLYVSSDKFKEKMKNLLHVDMGMGFYDTYLFPELIYKMNSNDSEDDATKTVLSKIIDIEGAPAFTLLKKKGQIVQESLKKLETVYMFLSNIGEFSIKVNRDKIQVSISKFDFRLTNFIWNIFNYEEHLNLLHDELNKQFKINGENARIQSDISILDDMRVWEKQYNKKQILPFWDIDLISYLLKRCTNEIKFENQKVFSKDMFEKNEWRESEREFHNGIKKFFELIEQTLELQDEFYKNAKRSEDIERQGLKENFKDCPIIKKVQQEEDLEFHLGLWVGVSKNVLGND